MASGKKEEERAARGTLLQFMEKEENRRPQHFLFPLRWREIERQKKPCLDTLDALILCDLL